ncbi:MAG: hypothetical protein J7J31_05490 [Helicobacteraceae bacterium]|nr:hypothetical protein [Helicobacteraceae bacterium]
MQYIYKTISSYYEDLLEHIQDYFYQAQDSLQKARNEIKIIDYKENKLVVKSFQKPHLFNSFIYTFFRDSKAKKSYDNTLRIEPFAPKAIGYIEYKKFALLNESYFVSEYFAYDFTIREPLLDQNFNDRVRILQQFAQFSYKMHEKNIFHNDYSPGNILIKKNGTSYIFQVVDVNRMKFFTLTSKDRARNFAQLWATDDDLRIISDEYLKYYKQDKKFFELLVHYSHKHKRQKNLKKRLKGKAVND